MKRLFTLITLLVIFSMVVSCAPAATPTEPAQPAAPTNTTAPAVAEPEPTEPEVAEPAATETTAVDEPSEPAATEPAAEGEGEGITVNKPVTVVFYQRGYIEGGTDAGSANTAKAIEAFQADNPNVTVEVVGIPWTAEGDTMLETALAARTDINVFRVTSPNLPRYAKQGILSDIEPFLTEADREDFYESGFQVATIDGKVWAWPLWVTAISIFANTEIFEERGVELPSIDDPWTWDEFVEAAKQMTYRRDDGSQVYGFTSSSAWGAVEYYPLMYIDGGRILSEDGTQFVQNEPEGVSAMQKLADLALVHQVTPPDFGTVDQAGVRTQFKDRRTVAMLMSTPGFIPDLEAEEFPLAVIPPPMGDANRLVTNGAFGLFAVVNNDDPDVLAASHLLAKYLTGAEVAEDVEGWQLAPGLRRSNTAYGTNEHRMVVAELVEYGVYEAPVAVSAEVGSQYGAALQEVILGVKTAEEAMNDIAPVYQDGLDAANSQ